ncbi:MAG: hypothetical protein ABI670_12910 [Chloroflexota bacterium]
MDNQHTEALDALDRTVRAYVYDHFITKGVAPSIRKAVSALSSGDEEMRAPEWRRWTVDEVEALFAEIGMVGAFWALRGPAGARIG